ncbi:hypothetical protein GGQ97_001422 [Sphingomonas kaistensis]|uniref:DUF2157 domain-containing protein n=1 Tax=Sphingomonas kaistensis TaxID=298708 RepID=A0A7X5Y5U1_9SPHN|nr:hypothetical protein [Sphingomonas kaistensis]NJC05629.1 hypothetical protein [Sphingomonas kaistensis]
MYSQNDLDDAVASGAITPEAATSLRAFVDQQRKSPAVDEEHFRLITGFNDIFVSIAAAILLFAVGWIGQSIGQNLGLVIDGEGPSFLAPALIASTAWGLALFFTARRRMALPSILLLLAFVGGTVASVGFLLIMLFANNDLEATQQTWTAGLIGAAAASTGALAAFVHWKRFRVPITVAAGAASVAGIAVALIAASIGDTPSTPNIILAVVLVLGLCVFLYAMRWDSSDPSRITRRSDVAFWLHLLAAPMIVHPVFTLLGLNDGDATVGEGLVVIAIYVVLGIAALAIDRRALLVSALAYVLFALNELFEQFGAVSLNIALTALVIGSALLLLSAFWHQARAAVVSRLPGSLRGHLPSLSPQPA